MKKFLDAYNKAMGEIVSEAKSEKWVADVKPKSGAMAKALGVKEGEKVSDKYTSGKKLAKDLVKAVGKKKAQGMLAFAANVSGESKSLFKTALSSLKLIKESDADDIDIPLDIEGTDSDIDKDNDDTPESDEEVTETVIDEFSPIEGCKLKLEKYEDGTFEVELEHYFDNEEEAKERFDKTVEWLKAEYENSEKEAEAKVEADENKEEEEKEETDEEK